MATSADYRADPTAPLKEHASLSSESTPPTVSVVMAVYNAERYLVEAVQSILDQTFKEFELIAVDDGSTDSSLDILKRFAATDSRVRIVQLAHEGVAAARNAAITLARGQFLAIMDADDVSLPDRFGQQLEFLAANRSCVAVGCEAMMIDPSGRDIGAKRHPLTHAEIDGRLMQVREAITHPAAMLRADAVRRIGGYRKHLSNADDHDLFLRLAEVGELANLPELLFRYRVHTNSISVVRMESQIRLAIESVREAVQRRGVTQDYRLINGVDPDSDTMLITTMVIQGYLWRAYLLLESGAYAAIHQLLDIAMEYARAKHAPWQLIGDLHAARATVQRRQGHLTHSMFSSIKSLVHQPQRMLRWRTSPKPGGPALSNGNVNLVKTASPQS